MKFDIASSPGHTHFSVTRRKGGSNIEKWVWPEDEAKFDTPNCRKVT